MNERLRELTNFRERVLRIMNGQMTRIGVRKEQLLHRNQEDRKRRGDLLIRRFTPFSERTSPKRSPRHLVQDRSYLYSMKAQRERNAQGRNGGGENNSYEFENPFSKKYGASLFAVYRESLLTPNQELENPL